MLALGFCEACLDGVDVLQLLHVWYIAQIAGCWVQAKASDSGKRGWPLVPSSPLLPWIMVHAAACITCPINFVVFDDGHENMRLINWHARQTGAASGLLRKHSSVGVEKPMVCICHQQEHNC